MKKLFVLFVSALLSANGCIVNAQSQERTPFLTRTFPASSIKEVECATAGGSITLTGDAGSQAKVEVYVSHNEWSADKIKKALEANYDLNIKVESGKLYVEAKPKNYYMSNWNQNGLNISFNISVPKQVNSSLQTTGGSIHISDLSGSQNFSTSGGSLTVENISGNMVGRTSGGSITVTGSNGNIDLSTSGGSVTANDCRGKIDLKTSGGSLTMNNLNGTVNASTSGGSITANNISGTFKTGTSGGSVRLGNISGNLEASTAGGSMDVTMKSTSDYVKLSNIGNINLTLPAAGKGYNLNVKGNKVENIFTTPKNFIGQSDDSSIEGTIDGGGTAVTVKSSQRIRLSFE